MDTDIEEAHAAASAAGAATYRDPRTGASVFTAAYLAARGRCCGSGCRHCPYKKLGSGELVAANGS